MATTKGQRKKLPDTLQQEDEVQAAIDYGIDISMLIQNLKKSYAERIIRHQIALNTVDKLRKARHP